jgi:RNase H-like domain found in reverse transcriptase/Reverse transcriptase (RNA-dependent DNA polymerase)
LPLTSELLNTPSRAKVFTKIDLKHAYHLIRIAAGDEWKTAFCTRYRSFEWLVMPFGLTNAPGGFQRFLNGIFSDLPDVYVIIYLDDILIFSDNKDDHFQHVFEVLKQLRKHGLYANGKECDFHSKSVDYLGHMIGPNRFQMDPAKVKVIQNWPEPQKVKDIQSFLGFANFYRQYIHNYSDIVVLLTQLTWKNIPWNFDESCKLAFLTLKQAFILAPVLTHYKLGCLLVIKTNASNYALAAILSQVESNREIHLVTYLSRTFLDTELNYDTHDKELMAIYEVFKAWQHYLKFQLMLSQTTKTWNIFVLHGFCPGDKLGGLLSCPDLIWLLDSVLATSEQNLMHLLIGITSTQKGRKSLMVQSIHKIVVLFFLLLNCPLLFELLQCFW